MNKAVGIDGIPVELFQILKDDAVKVLHSVCKQIWKTQQWPQDWKRLVFIQSKRKARPKYAQTTTQLHPNHILVKQCSKFSKIGFNSIGTMNFQMFNLDLEKTEQQEIKLPTSTGLSEKAMVSHSSTLAWKIPWTEEPGRLWSMGSLRVRHD